MDMTTKFIPIGMSKEGAPVLVGIDKKKTIIYTDTAFIENKIKQQEELLIDRAFRAECPERISLGEGFFHTSFGEEYSVKLSRNYKG